MGFVFPSIILKVSRTLRLVFIPGPSEWWPLFSERWGTLICGPHPLFSSGALVSGSRAVAGGDSRGIDAFVSGSKVMSPAALSCVYDEQTHTKLRSCFSSGIIRDLFLNSDLLCVVLLIVVVLALVVSCFGCMSFEIEI